MGANAQTTVPTFTTGQVLTADQQNQSARTGVPVFASTVTRDAGFGGTGEKTLAEGQLCYVEGTGLQSYNGSSWVTWGAAPSAGLTFISATTIGSAVSTVTVSSAFSSTYDNYFVSVSGGIASQDNNLTIQLGATNTGYYQWQTYGVYSSNTVNGDAVNNGASFTVGRGNANTLQAAAWLMGPNLAKRTVCFAQRIGASTTSTITFSTVGAFQDTDTQYTAFTLGTNAGTMTGGTIRLYGFQNS